MGYFIRTLTHFGYTRVARPLLFTRPPDEVHTKTVVLGEKLAYSSFIRKLAYFSWNYASPRLSQTIHGIAYINPVGLAAGFDKNVQLAPMMEAIGFGHVTGGSVTGRSCAGNPRPWFYRLPEHKAIVVHAGLGNIGSSALSRSLPKVFPRNNRKIPLTISVARTNTQETSSDEAGINDYILALRTLRRHADVFEINISCPNTYGGEPFTKPERLHKLLKAIDQLYLSQPVYIKMPSNLEWRAYNALLKTIVKHDVQGVTICNLRKDRSALTLPREVKGSISGLPVQHTSDELIAKTYRHYGDRLVIIGVGGIFTAEDAYRKIKKGASLVELATGLIYEGPSTPGAINHGLTKLLKADGYSSISDAIGVDVHGSTQHH